MELHQRIFQGLCSTEAAGDLGGRPQPAQGWYRQNCQVVELIDAVAGVLGEQLVEDLPRFGTELLKEIGVVPADTAYPFVAGGERLVPGDVHEDVQSVYSHQTSLFFQVASIDPQIGEIFGQLLARRWIRPFGAELGGGAGKEAADGVGNEIPVLHQLRLPGHRIELVEGLADHPHLFVSHVETVIRSALDVSLIGITIRNGVPVFRFRLGDHQLLDYFTLLVDGLPVDALRRAVELGIGEDDGRPGVVDDVKGELVRVFVDARPTPDDLFEHRH